MPSQQLCSTTGLATAVLLWSHFQQFWEKGKTLSTTGRRNAVKSFKKRNIQNLPSWQFSLA